MEDIKYLELSHSLQSLGAQLMKDCPDNDCIIFRNIYEDYQRSLAQYKVVADQLTDTLKIGMKKMLRDRKNDLIEMYEGNYAIQQYKKK